jgi:uncharacterized protein with GYD domain
VTLGRLRAGIVAMIAVIVTIWQTGRWSTSKVRRPTFRRNAIAGRLLATYTEQGIEGIEDTVKRTESVKELARQADCTMQESYWTLGAFDVVAVFEAPDDETMTAFSLSVAKLGNVKTQTLRAFSVKDMGAILGKIV